MTAEKLTSILDSLLSLPAETEVVEFKRAERNFDDRDLGQYFSALSNEANLKEKDCAWLIFGIENKSHEVVGSQYKNSRPALDARKKLQIKPLGAIPSSRYMSYCTETGKEL